VKATLEIRQAIRPWIEAADSRILIGVSGGADSLALAVAATAEARKHSLDLVAIIIDHQLQEGSRRVAEQTRAILEKIGYQKIEIIPVEVVITDGLESSARRARYEAFQIAIEKYRPDYFFLAHTKNDLAESVLLGLARGSGTRSLSGIAEQNGAYIRPLLGIDRESTESCCQENQIEPWNDPQNRDPAYLRSRVRHQVLPILEREMGPGIIEALARSSRILREDADALDSWVEELLVGNRDELLEVQFLGSLPKAIRIRLLRRIIYKAGAPEGSLSADHLAPVEALVTQWHGQGQISLPGSVKVERISGRLSLSQEAN
jgi:tRNA(Ile)-lysidine synthase